MRASRAEEAALIELLRSEALRSRPEFDAAAAARVIAAVRSDAPPRGFPRRGDRGAWRVAVAFAFLGLACGAATWWAERVRPGAGAGDSSSSIASTPPIPGLEVLPTFDELGADVAGSIGSLAATVVGLPDWRDLAVADLPIVDAWRFDREAGFAGGAEGSADPGPTR